MISAKIILDSISLEGDRITTFELVYPRFIHGELMTHRMFSRNASSSRAIPIKSFIDMVKENPAMPIQWGLDKPGMQAGGVHSHPATCVWAWQRAAERAVVSAEELKDLGLHKQIVNRVLEPFQWMKTIVTATEFDNFWWLRCHTDAQPEIHALAEQEMYRLYKDSEPQELRTGEWHLPYVAAWRMDGEQVYAVSTGLGIEAFITLEEAQKISASCCAQVSYRKLDDSLEKALTLYKRLVDNEPLHASPFEHIATPMVFPDVNKGCCSWDLDAYDIDEGVTHMDMTGKFWSGNLKGWIQYRHLLDNNTCWEYNA